MRTSPAGRNFIKRFEGYRDISYQDIAGIWTIGYGHTKGVLPDQEITEEQGDEFLALDLLPGENAINSLVNQDIFLLQSEFDALSSLVYNIGPGNFKRSTLYKHLWAKRFIEARDQFIRWNKARINGELRPVKGLTRRRIAERELFANGVYDEN